MLGKIIDNRYEILEKIGGGGMAIVYKARDTLLGRMVAIKFLRTQFTHDEEFVRRFRREAQIAASLSHPNIVNIYDVGTQEEDYFIVMEYVPGITLKEMIAENAPLLPGQALEIAQQVCEALEHAHQNNLVHCDIKPHNILITKTGRVKVADFGIARAVTSATITQTGTVMGSVHYLSPEQARGGVASPQSDLYSLGVVLYEMLTAEMPFKGENPISIALKHLQEEIVPPSKLRPDLPLDIEDLVMKALAKEPEKRYQTAGEMLKDINFCLRNLQNEQTKFIIRNDYPTQIVPIARENREKTQPDVSNAKALSRETADDVPVPKREKKRRHWLLISLLVLALLAGGGYLLWSYINVGETVVPDVTGMSLVDAQNTLKASGFNSEVGSRRADDNVPAGHVISQSPPGNQLAKKTRVVVLTVSEGIGTTIVPNVKGLSLQDAIKQIEAAGLVVGRQDRVPGTVPLDTVLDQNPKPTLEVKRKTPIDLVISQGQPIKLPDFRGTDFSNVQKRLESLRLKLGTVTDEFSNIIPAGYIISQSPAPNTDVSEDTAINFVVSKGRSPGGNVKSKTISVDLPKDNNTHQVRIDVLDSSGRRTVFDDTAGPGGTVTQTVEGVGTVRVQVFIDGNLVKEDVF